MTSATMMKDITNSPLLLILVVIGLAYIVGFSLVYLKKSYDHCLELGMTKEELHKIIQSSAVFSIVPSLSIVVGLFVLISVMGVVWSWWRLSVIGSLSYETMIGEVGADNGGVLRDALNGDAKACLTVAKLYYYGKNDCRI